MSTARSLFNRLRGREDVPDEGVQPGKSGGQTKPRRRLAWRSWAIFLGLLAFNYIVVARIVPDQPDRLEVPYTLFRQQIDSGNVIEVMSRGDTIQGRFRTPVTYPPEGESGSRTLTDFSTYLPVLRRSRAGEPDDSARRGDQCPTAGGAAKLVDQSAPELRTNVAAHWRILLVVTPRAGQLGGAMSMGQSKAKRYDQAAVEGKVTFQDVAGIEEAERELEEIVDFLKDPNKYTRLGGIAPKGVLLVGLPARARRCWPALSRVRPGCPSSPWAPQSSWR